MSSLNNFAKFSGCHGFFRQPKSSADSRFYLYKDKYLVFDHDDIELPIPFLEIPFNDGVLVIKEILTGKVFADFAEAFLVEILIWRRWVECEPLSHRCG